MNRIKTTTGMVAMTLLAAGSASAWDLKVTDDKAISFHGFGSQGFLATSKYNYLGQSDEGSFAFTEVGLNAAYSPFNRARIAVQGFAFDVGDVGELQPFLDYASFEYIFDEKIGVRAGRVRRPAGIYNHIQDVDLARTAILLPQGIYDPRWRDFSASLDGGEFFGNFSLGKAGSLGYEAYAGVNNLSDRGGISRWVNKSLEQSGGHLESTDSFICYGGQLWWSTPLSGLRAGVALWATDGFAYDGSLPMFGGIQQHGTSDAFNQLYSVEYLWKNWTFQAEFLRTDGEGENSTTVFGNTTTTSTTRTEDVWYASAAYRFNKWLEVGAYYTEYYIEEAQTRPSDEYQKDVALSLRFDPTDWWILKLEGHYIRGTALLRDAEANRNETFNGDGWWMIAAKTTFSF